MRRKTYPSDLSDEQWKPLRCLLPKAKPGGRPRSVDLRAVIDGILSIVRRGCSWRMMPVDLPPWSTCYDYFRKWRASDVWKESHDRLRTTVRHRAGKARSASAAILDSQSVKTAEGGPKSYDAGKKIAGSQAAGDRRHDGAAASPVRHRRRGSGPRRRGPGDEADGMDAAPDVQDLG